MLTSQADLEHDINSAMSSLRSGAELACEEWKTNPELVERILPLMIDKINEIQINLKNLQQKK